MGWGGVLRHCYILHLIGFGGEDGELVGGGGAWGDVWDSSGLTTYRLYIVRTTHASKKFSPF